MDSITDKLYNAGLIRYKSLFNFYADISHAEKKIDPGIYDLNTRYDYHALVNMMSASSTREVVEDLLIPEGYTCRQIFALLEENRICTAQDLSAYAANGALKDYWFLENVTRGDKYCLEASFSRIPTTSIRIPLPVRFWKRCWTTSTTGQRGNARPDRHP